MIRRAALRIPDSGAGYVLEGLVKTDADNNQTYVFVFELTGTGVVTEETTANVKFTDGSPAEVPSL